ncbi:MAG TPA: Rrf2 family transcriptional regulator [Elusimicrobiales bacterium]|nr:Rrf2 family transcriptional regulator [Elusimicrobiales bacterium]
MKLTTKSEYSLLAVIYIARAEKKNGELVRVEDISERYGIPRKYLEQLLLILKQNGLLLAKRGANGGYRLAKPASRITAAQVIRMMDGALAPSESVSKHFFSHTPIEKEKKMQGVLREIRDYVADRLEKLTLAELI